MTNKEYTIDNLKKRKKEILEQLDIYEFFKYTKYLREELYEIEDTLKKLNEKS